MPGVHGGDDRFRLDAGGEAVMFKYFGSKARLAPTYQPPRHDLIIEPFAGAAGYSMYWLTRRSDLRCLLVDSDPRVAELWNLLLAMDPAELWSYPIPRPGTRTTDPIYRSSSAGTNGWDSKGPEYQITEWMADAFVHIRQRMAQTLSIVRGRVEVREDDYRKAPDVEATWFIDPPYQREGNRYATGNAIDFRSLGRWSMTRDGQVIVCESDGADWMDFSPHVTNKTVGTTNSVEVVWYSDPEPTLLEMMS